MKLFYFPGACSLASHISLHESGLAFETARIDLQTKRTPDGQDYRQINPKGYVPALQLDDGAVLTENVAVLQYIADRVPDRKLAPPAGSLERYRLIEWLAFITSEVHKSMSPFFNPAATEETRTYMRNLLTRRADWLDTELGGRQFLLGDQFTVADAYLFTILTWMGPRTVEIGKWRNLEQYRERIRTRPAVQKAMEAEGLTTK